MRTTSEGQAAETAGFEGVNCLKALKKKEFEISSESG
jgi:hypothetical protein